MTPGVIHLDSKVSGGDYSIERLVRLAESYGQEVVIITDHDNSEATYGIWPLENIIKKTIEQNSIKKYGAKRYIFDVKEAQKAHPDIVAMHGAEAIPFYYWQGSFWDKNLRLINFHKHILVIGLDSADDYENLPSIANGFSRRFSFTAILSLWPLAFVIFGGWLFFKGSVQKVRFGEQVFLTHSLFNRILAVVIFLIGALFLVNNFPFAQQKFDQYHGDLGTGPYQELIDYVNSKGGLTFWAHPEVEQKVNVSSRSLRGFGTEIYTDSYQTDLLNTYNYTGFAVFEEGMKFIGKPGGIWDRVLDEYCIGAREKPAWAIGEVDFEGGGSPDEAIKHTQTFFLLKEKSEKGVLEALRSGKMYAARAIDNALFLAEFSVSNPAGNVALMGDELDCPGRPKVRISISNSLLQRRPKPISTEAFSQNPYLDNPETGSIQIELIRKGEVIRTFHVDNPADIEYIDNYYRLGEKTYYRLIIRDRGLAKIVSNPIFVKFSGRQ
ncbi:TPA: hypothetical protein EYP66_19770 [Candidatus Poribacteria bacterium]|nr:hypothetical protein [Candidatus Poribacteria bacterium]